MGDIGLRSKTEDLTQDRNQSNQNAFPLLRKDPVKKWPANWPKLSWAIEYHGGPKIPSWTPSVRWDPDFHQLLYDASLLLLWLVCSWQLRWALRRLMWVGPDIFYQWCMTYDDRNCIVPYVFICPKQALNLHMMFEFFLSALPAAEVVFITKISGSAVASHCRWSLGVHSWCCSGSRWCQPRSGWYYSLFIHQILALRAHQE